MSRRHAAVLLAILLAVLTGCSQAPAPPAPVLQDRGGIEGSSPDFVLDVAYVEVYRNIDHFPNIARVCVAGLGFAVTSTGAGTSIGATPLIRVIEWDDFCAAKESGATPAR